MADQRRIEDLKRRVQQDPASIAFAALADEYRRAGLFREAVDTCRAGLQRHPAYLSARVTLGRALLELGELNEAEAELEHVVRAAPENLAAIRALADIHRRRAEIHPEPSAHEAPLALSSAPADKATTGSVSAVPIAPSASPAVAPGPQPIRPVVAEQKSHAESAAATPAAPPALRLATPAPPAEPPPGKTRPVARPDPAIPRLEAFLDAIRRARGAVEKARSASPSAPID